MTTRPGPRKSSLAGATPATPSQPTPTAAAPVEKKKRPKVSFYQDQEDTERARAAWFHTQVSEGARSWSEFIQHAVMAETERLEAKYNGGRAYEGMGPREVPQGRPVGS